MPKEGQQADNVRAFVEEYEKDKLLTPKPKRKVIGKERFNYNLRIKNLQRKVIGSFTCLGRDLRYNLVCKIYKI